MMYGQDAEKIQKVVRTRSVKQVAQRITNILRRKQKVLGEGIKAALEAEKIKEKAKREGRPL